MHWTAIGVALIGLWSAGMTGVRSPAHPVNRSAPPIALRSPEPERAEPPLAPTTRRVHPTEPKSDPQARAQVHAQRSELEANFRDERTDPEWAAQYGQHLRNLFAAVGVADSAIRAVECRSTLCRLELAGADPAALSAIAGQLDTSYWVQPTAENTLDILIARPAGQGI